MPHWRLTSDCSILCAKQGLSAICFLDNNMIWLLSPKESQQTLSDSVCQLCLKINPPGKVQIHHSLYMHAFSIRCHSNHIGAFKTSLWTIFFFQKLMRLLLNCICRVTMSIAWMVSYLSQLGALLTTLNYNSEFSHLWFYLFTSDFHSGSYEH